MVKPAENRTAPHCGFPDNQVGNNRCSIEIHRGRVQRESEKEREGEDYLSAESGRRDGGEMSREEKPCGLRML